LTWRPSGRALRILTHLNGDPVSLAAVVNVNRALCLAVFRLTDGRDEGGDWISLWEEEARSPELAWSTLGPYQFIGASTLLAINIVVAIGFNAALGSTQAGQFLVWFVIAAPVVCGAFGGLTCWWREKRSEAWREGHGLPIIGEQPAWEVNLVANPRVLLASSLAGYAVAALVAALASVALD
jgi:hypothetical protein